MQTGIPATQFGEWPTSVCPHDACTNSERVFPSSSEWPSDGSRPVNDASHENAGDERLKAALFEYFERVDRGETPNVEVFASQYADIADELKAVLSANEE